MVPPPLPPGAPKTGNLRRHNDSSAMYSSDERAAALAALPAEIQQDLGLVKNAAIVLSCTNDVGAHQLAAATLVAAYRASGAADA